MAKSHTSHDRMLPDVPHGPYGMVATLRRAFPDLQGILDEGGTG